MKLRTFKKASLVLRVFNYWFRREFFFLKYIITVTDLIISDLDYEIQKILTENTFLRGKPDELASHIMVISLASVFLPEGSLRAWGVQYGFRLLEPEFSYRLPVCFLGFCRMGQLNT